MLTGCLKVQGKPKAVYNCEHIKCAACEFGKDHYQPDKRQKTKKNPMKNQYSKKHNPMHRQTVFVDKYISRATGRLYHTKVKSDPYEMLLGGCVFIDHGSGYTRINNQVYINATETVK